MSRTRIQIDFPKSTPAWLKGYVRALENDVDRLEKDKKRIQDKLGKTQGYYQDLLDLVEQIASGRELDPIYACQKMANRFNPGLFYEEQ